PFLSRIPVLGHLFGTTSRTHDRKELIVLITPRVISNAEKARAITDEYQTKLDCLRPILQEDASAAAARYGQMAAASDQGGAVSAPLATTTPTTTTTTASVQPLPSAASAQ